MTTRIDWNRLLEFVGYGPTEGADLVFLGLEEKAREGSQNLAARSHFEAIEDLRNAHDKILGPAGCRNPFAESGNPVQQWNTAACIALAIEGRNDWRERRAWQPYWRELLGRNHGSTFLMECFPFPRMDRSTQVPGAPRSEADVWERRRVPLVRHLRLNPPTFMVAYGAPTKAKAADLLAIPDGEWREVPGVKHPVSVATNGRTRVAHVGFFGRGFFARDDIPAAVRALRAL